MSALWDYLAVQTYQRWGKRVRPQDGTLTVDVHRAFCFVDRLRYPLPSYGYVCLNL